MKSHWSCFALLTLLSAAPLLLAEDAVPPPLKLDAALAKAQPSPGEVTLTVDAAHVSLPEGAVRPGTPMTGPEVGALYGQKTQPFGTVTAIAPPTITVVYAPPDTPNPYDGMPPGQVMKLLTQTFTPAQWKAFMSPAGVGYTDMQGDIQPPLFQALFPGGHLEIIEDNPVGDNDPKTKRDFSGDALTAAHLRLGSITSLALQQTEDPNGHLFAAGLRPAGSPPRFFMMNSEIRDVDKEYGAQVHETIPNTPKAGQIAFDDPALKAAVPLAGIKTVDDLIIRISRAANRAIYADPRYGTRLVTFSSSAQSAPAADLLQALALCVGGTYRRVGPAFVLTDDIIGLGTKHALWKAFEDKAQSMLPGGGEFSPPMAPNPDMPYTVRDIPDSGDPLAFTKAQKESYWKKWVLNPGQSSSGMMDVTVPFEQLSSGQQEAAEMMQEDNEKRNFHTMLGGTVMVQFEPEVEIMMPELSGPVIIFQSYNGLLPYPALSPAQEQAQRKRMEIDFPDMAPQDTPSPDFTKTLRGFARRAALIAPKTPTETTQALAALSALGFTEAWLQIVPGPAASDAETRTRLASAAAEGRKLGIRVLPDISLLHWQDGTDASLLDCDIQGQTVLPRNISSFSPVVSPFSPAVVQRLTEIVHALGSVPGIGGMVWENTLSAGYEKFVQGENVYGGSDDSLGYSEAGRLAFLRLDHADPVDTCDNSFSDERAQVHVPGFDSDSNTERRLFTDWKKARADTSQTLMQHLATALPSSFSGAASRLPLLLPPTNAIFVPLLGSWDDLRRPGPIVQFIVQPGPDGQPVEGRPNLERMSSVLAYNKVQLFLPQIPSGEAWKSAAARALEQAAKQGDRNIVLDMTAQSSLLQEAPKPAKD